MAALGWLLNLDFAGGEAVAPVVITTGLEFTTPENLAHFTQPDNRAHFTIPDED